MRLVIALLLACATAFRAPARVAPFPRVAPRLAATTNAAVPLGTRITDAFPAWVAGFAVLGATPYGAGLARIGGAQITAGLALTMLAMGTTLTAADFARVARRPGAVALGFCAQYGIMPLAAVASVRVWRLPPALAAGVCLVGCCPGGTASNLVALIADADVALSIAMTTASTVAACALTPVLASLCVGARAPVSRAALCAATVKVVLAPVVAGLALRRAAPAACDEATPLLAPAAVLLVAVICGSVVASTMTATSVAPALVARVLGAVLTLHGLGFLLGYRAAAAAGLDEAARRTVSIETGMQNSALACVLAGAAGLPPIAAFPGAVSATCHSLIGSALARRWRRAAPRTVPPAFERVAWSGTCYPAR